MAALTDSTAVQIQDNDALEDISALAYVSGPIVELRVRIMHILHNVLWQSLPHLLLASLTWTLSADLWKFATDDSGSAPQPDHHHRLNSGMSEFA